MVINNEFKESEFDDSAQPPEPNNEDNQDEAEVGDISDEDVERLNDQLDQLNNALDVLEQKNENIQARLLELLRSSRELRNGVNNEEDE